MAISIYGFREGTALFNDIGSQSARAGRFAGFRAARQREDSAKRVRVAESAPPCSQSREKIP
jgi:hypothetical protein